MPILEVSTDDVYGSLGAKGSFTEKSLYAPNSLYAASKASADPVYGDGLRRGMGAARERGR